MDKVLCKVYSIYGKTVAENFTDRMTGRTGERAQQAVAAATVKQFALLRYGPNAKVGWKRKLGCSCGCSPGWRVYVPMPDFSSPDWESKARVFHEGDAYAGTVEESRRGGWKRKRSGPLEAWLEDNEKGDFRIELSVADDNRVLFPPAG